MKHVLSGLWPGGAVLSKAARPKTVAPVSLAGFKPPAAAADRGVALKSQTSEQTIMTIERPMFPPRAELRGFVFPATRYRAAGKRKTLQ